MLSLLSLQLPFNPSLVRLAPSARGCQRRRGDDFQSQLGSIGAPCPPVTSLVDTSLSIPAWFDWRVAKARRPRPEEPAFNPSLVRLAPTSRPPLPAGQVPFNPSLVRLAHMSTVCLSTAPSPLPIPAWFDWRPLRGRVRGAGLRPFNPSLVRLAPGGARLLPHPAACFNPSLVRLARG